MVTYCEQEETRLSWAWASLLEGRKLLGDGARWQVRDGSNIKIGGDNWLPSSRCPRRVPCQVTPGRIPTFIHSLIDRDREARTHESILNLLWKIWP